GGLGGSRRQRCHYEVGGPELIGTLVVNHDIWMRRHEFMFDDRVNRRRIDAFAAGVDDLKSDVKGPALRPFVQPRTNVFRIREWIEVWIDGRGSTTNGNLARARGL